MEQALYDRPAVYDALYASKDYEGEVAFTVDRFDAHGNGGRRVLLVGCGTGRHSAVLDERGFEVTGVDPNPAMLDRARERSAGRFLRGGLPDLTSAFDAAEPPTFDLVWAPFTVLDYLEPDQLAPALEAMTDRLADGGVLVFDLGGFPDMDAPTLQVASDTDRDCARLYQFRRQGERARMDALVFVGENWFVDAHTLTVFDRGTVADSLGELGYAVETHEWYEGTSSGMVDPAVLLAH
jgi:SAM-dependent methyltransferase